MCIRDRYIAAANGYKSSLVDKLISKHKEKKIKKSNNDNTLPVNKYISADYTNILPNILVNELKKRHVIVTFRTNNSIQRFLSRKNSIPERKRTGVYKMNCSSCDMFYIGQTGRPFEERYKEHLPRRELHKTSNFARHLMLCNHNYSDFQTNFQPMHCCRKGKYMDALEEYEIYKAVKINSDYVLNDKLTFSHNILYDTAILAHGRR